MQDGVIGVLTVSANSTWNFNKSAFDVGSLLFTSTYRLNIKTCFLGEAGQSFTVIEYINPGNSNASLINCSSTVTIANDVSLQVQTVGGGGVNPNIIWELMATPAANDIIGDFPAAKRTLPAGIKNYTNTKQYIDINSI